LVDDAKVYDLQAAKTVMLWEERERLSKGQQGLFLVSSQQFKERLGRLSQSVEKIEEMANIRYRDIRSRSEDAFRQEILSYIRRFERVEDLFSRCLLYVLQRMRSFWGFEIAGFLWYEPETSNVRVVGYESQGGSKAYGFSGPSLGKVAIDERKSYSTKWYYDPSEKEDPQDPLVRKFKPIWERALEKLPLELGREKCYFVVTVPSGEGIYVFVFSGHATISTRTPEELMHLKQCVYGLDQEFIFRTCSEVMHEFHNLRGRTQLDIPHSSRNSV
jgi:hypothetical protein